ncbi:hypothetical protein ANN_23423 [Periplaneta americana]|uniref:Uncharacterized protein n=1 Tax=Periplaneta americana TaxID=6978 RepID=A0ABQ8SMC9_PERAM|nr:hypothetical protein ANN_23423 [Periplaneta americana]
MSPGSSTESYPAFAHIGLRENPGKNLNQITCPDRESKPGHLVSRPDAVTITSQVYFWVRGLKKSDRTLSAILMLTATLPTRKKRLQKHVVCGIENRAKNIASEGKRVCLVSYLKRVGRPTIRSLDDLEKDLKSLQVSRWKREAQDRAKWRRVNGAALAPKKAVERKKEEEEEEIRNRYEAKME